MIFIQCFELKWINFFFFREAIDVQYILTRDEDRLLDAIELIKPASNDDYIGKIRKRLQEDESARAEREKRRRKVLVDQMKAHEAQEVWYKPKPILNIQPLLCLTLQLPNLFPLLQSPVILAVNNLFVELNL